MVCGTPGTGMGCSAEPCSGGQEGGALMRVGRIFTDPWTKETREQRRGELPVSARQALLSAGVSQ